jgi:hypothetical protein
MAKVFYLHWNREELEHRVRPLQAAGHQVASHWSTDDHIQLGDFAPEVVVISLDRLPSHGRQVAEWFWEAKKRRVIPILFAGGKADKVEATRTRFPDAVYCASEEVAQTLAGVLPAAAAGRSGV